ncbi:unnamed protein product [Clonostachys solani]|uniref:Uncharacterized protein n=1 Tax=Clonostachys solani TaxID=160281 RepID=A0A9N9Z290_9HYPO|nr:unnamed protein product [Clonostachys solani]
MRHTLNLALGIVDCLGDSAGELITITTNYAVGLTQDLAALLNQGLDLPDQGLFVQLFLGSTLCTVDLVCDQLAHRSDLVQDLLNASAELSSKLPVLFIFFLQLGFFLTSLSLLFSLLLNLRRNVLKKRYMANGVALGVDNIAIVIATDKFANDVAILVDNVAFAVHSSTSERIFLLLNLGLLPPFGLSKDVAVFVHDIATRELCKGAVLGSFALTLRNNLSLADNVARLAAHITFLVAHAANKSGNISFDDAAIDDARRINDVASLVDTLSSQTRAVNYLLSFSFWLIPSLSLTNDIAVSVKDVSILVDLATLEAFGVALNDDADLDAVRGHTTVCLDDGIREILEWCKILLLITVARGQRLAPADNLAATIPNVAVLVACPALEVLDVALDNLADNFTFGINQIANLVDFGVLQRAGVTLFWLLLYWDVLLLWLSLADNVSVSVKNVAVLVDLAAFKTLGVAFNDDADLLTLGGDTAVRFNDSIWEVLKRSEVLAVIALSLRNGLGLSNNLAGIVPDVALFIGLLSKDLLDVALDNTANHLALVIDEIANLVYLGALEDGVVEFLSLLSFSFLSLKLLACLSLKFLSFLSLKLLACLSLKFLSLLSFKLLACLSLKLLSLLSLLACLSLKLLACFTLKLLACLSLKLLAFLLCLACFGFISQSLLLTDGFGDISASYLALIGACISLTAQRLLIILLLVIFEGYRTVLRSFNSRLAGFSANLVWDLRRSVPGL